MSFDKVNIRDRDFQSFRQHTSGSICRAVHVDNTAQEAIPVYITDETISDAIIKNFFSEAVIAPSTVETTIVSYTVPVGKAAKILRVEFGGENYGLFSVYKNSVKIGKLRTWWMAFSGVFNFSGGTADGYPLSTGDTVELKVLHVRTGTVEFEGRIQVVES